MDGSPGKGFHRPLRALIALIAVLLLAPAPGPASASPTQVRFIREARSDFDHYLTGAGSQVRAWMRHNYWRMRGYAPFFTEHAVGWAPPSHFYKDAYAIYNDRRGYEGMLDLNTLDSHPSWVLRDAAGRRLFIPWACSGGSCTQYAADIGNPGFRSAWIAQAREQLEGGYRGIYIDDVNLDWRVSDGWGNFVKPIDPRTGRPMTLARWRRYFAVFMEEVRAAFPDEEIVHNGLWWVEHSDPSLRRQVAAADFIHLERGFNDAGIVRGDGKYGFITFLRHIRWLHRRGKSVIVQPYDLNRRRAEYELASHLLSRARQDAVMSDYRANPGNFWRGWKVDLGAPRGTWRRWKGLLRRDFRGGMVLVNQPGSARKRVRVPRRRLVTLAGKRVRRVSLGPARGKVLRKP